MLLQGNYRYANFDNPGELAGSIKNDILKGDVKAAYVFGNRLFVHGGLRSKIRELIIDEVVKGGVSTGMPWSSKILPIE